MLTLAASQFTRARALYRSPYLAMIMEAAIAASFPATIWADDATQPRSALLWDKGHCLYLGGTADSAPFLQELGAFVATTLVPELCAHFRGIFKVCYDHPLWEEQIGTVFPNVPLIKAERVALTLREVRLPDWRARLPEGYAVRAIDRELLADRTRGNYQDLVDEIEECWGATAPFLERGFGFCMLYHEREIVCRCTAEYVSPGKCGTGIATIAEHQSRGLATLTASAFAEYCQGHHITTYWDAWKNNLPSVRVAEKVGFQKITDYMVYFADPRRKL